MAWDPTTQIQGRVQEIWNCALWSQCRQLGRHPELEGEAQHPREVARAGPCAPDQHKISPITSEVTPHLFERQQLPASDGLLPAHFTSNLGELISSTCLWKVVNLSTLQSTFLQASLFSRWTDKGAVFTAFKRAACKSPNWRKSPTVFDLAFTLHLNIKVAAASSVK